jgi:hypothetical protein
LSSLGVSSWRPRLVAALATFAAKPRRLGPHPKVAGRFTTRNGLKVPRLEIPQSPSSPTNRARAARLHLLGATSHRRCRRSQTSNANIAVSLIAVLVNPWSGTRKRMVDYAE